MEWAEHLRTAYGIPSALDYAEEDELAATTFGDLDDLISKSKAKVAEMSPGEVEEMLAVQRENYGRNYRPGPRQARLIR